MKQVFGARIALILAICMLIVLPVTAAPNYVEVNKAWDPILNGSTIYDSIVKGQNGFATIQEGINAVDPGGEVFVYAGTYNEDVIVNKSLSLFGEENAVDPTVPGWNGNTIIVASSSGGFLNAGYSPYIIASDVTFSGFKVTGAAPALYIGGDGVTLDNIKVQNCELTGRTEAGILVSNRSDSQITNIQVDQIWSHDNPTGNGVMLYNINGVVVSNSLIQKNGLSTGTAEKQFGIWVTGNTGGIEIGNTITGNTFTGNQGGSILISPNIGQTVGAMAIHQNKFLDSGPGVKNDGFPAFIDSTENWWDAVCVPNVALKTLGLVDYDPWYLDSDMTTLSDSPGARPTAQFAATPKQGSLPLEVSFTDASTSFAPINTWNWSFGDDSYQNFTGSAPVMVNHTYTTPGVYTVKLTVLNCLNNPNNKDSVTKKDLIKAGVEPTAKFSATPNSGDAPLFVTFTDESTTPAGNITSWNWDFGDGNFSTSQNVTHTYSVSGTFESRLTVQNSFNQTDSKKKNITVSIPLPIANFSADMQSGSAPLPVNFIDLSTSYAPYPINSWNWNFGDGGSNNMQNPSYVYLTPGTYPVSLTVTNAGGSNSTIKNGYITVYPVVDPDFTSNVTSGASPLSVQFNDTSTGNPTIWQWDFGDGDTSNLQNPTHVYLAEGSYDVTLRAGNPGGSNQIIKNGYISVIVGPVANFKRSPTVGGLPLLVNFTDNSTGDPTSWHWDFGDGNTSNQENASHTYNALGNFSVTLQVSNAAGSNETTKVIRVIPAPVADFTGTPVLGTVPLEVQFNDTSDVSDPTFWQWDFGDGQIAGGGSLLPVNYNPLHTYNAPGTYTVSLLITNPAGQDMITKTSYITVVTTPVASFSTDPDPAEGNAPLVVRFTDTSSGTPRLVTWNFGDGSLPSNDKNPLHVYTRAGVYNVTLTAQNMAGYNSTTKQVKVKVLPVASFGANQTTGIAPLNVQFTDTSTGVPTSWEWNFGDGNTSTLKHPQHEYTTPGSYTVRLNVSNDAGSDEVTRANFITVKTPLRASFSFTTSNPDNTSPLMVSFMDTSPDHPTTWEWSFGDGSTSSLANPVHVYLNPGNYTVIQKVTNYIEYGMTSQVIAVNEPLIADFKAEPVTGSIPLTVAFKDTSTGSNITQWDWTFGDLQEFSTTNPAEKNPVHTYHVIGPKTVSLTVHRGSAMNSTVKTSLIQVLPFP